MDETTTFGVGFVVLVVMFFYGAVELTHAIRGDVTVSECQLLCRHNVRSLKNGDCECFTADGGVP